jgi:ABC-type transport system substrate-binding protein
LAKAGYPGGKGLSFTMVGFNDPTSIKVEQAIQAQLAQLGIKATVKPEALGPLIQGVLTPNTDQAGYALWQDDYADPEDFMWNMFYSKNPGGWDISFYSNPTLDALITAGDTTVNGASRLSDYNRAQALALAAHAWIPLFYGVTDILKQPDIYPTNKLYYLHPVLQLQLQYLYKK